MNRMPKGAGHDSIGPSGTRSSMKAPTFDELVLLPEPLAIQRHFDARNYRAFRFVLVLVTILCLAGIAQAVESSNSLAGAIYALDIIAGAILFGLRRQEFFTRNFRQILLVYLFVQILVLKFTAAPLNEGEKGPFIAVAFLLLVFRLRLAEHVMLFVSFWAAAVFPLSWLGVRRAATEPADPGGVIAVSIVSLVCLLAAAGFTQLTRRRFLAVWRREHSRHRERLRMRE